MLRTKLRRYSARLKRRAYNEVMLSWSGTVPVEKPLWTVWRPLLVKQQGQPSVERVLVEAADPARSKKKNGKTPSSKGKNPRGGYHCRTTGSAQRVVLAEMVRKRGDRETRAWLFDLLTEIRKLGPRSIDLRSWWLGARTMSFNGVRDDFLRRRGLFVKSPEALPLPIVKMSAAAIGSRRKKEVKNASRGLKKR